MNLKFLTYVFLTPLLVILLVACNPGSENVAELVVDEVVEFAPTETSVPTTVMEATQTATEVVEAEVELDIAPEEDAIEVEPVETQVVLPTPRAELYATDPSSVSLASGDFQFVELFAYW